MLPIAAAAIGALGALMAARDVSANVDSSMLITTSKLADENSCLSAGFRGSYGSVAGVAEHVYIVENTCLMSESRRSGFVDEGSIVSISKSPSASKQRLIWIGEAGVEGKIFKSHFDGRAEISQILQGMQTGLQAFVRPEAVQWPQGDQQVFSASDAQTLKGVEVVHAGATSAIIAVEEYLLPMLDAFIPQHLSAVALPEESIPSLSAESAYGPPVEKSLIDNLQKLTKHLKFKPEIDGIVSSLDKHLLKQDIMYLTGEREDSDIVSRQSFTPGARKAAEWIREKVQATGAECSLQPFMPGFSPNVICTYPSLDPNSTELVLLSAHYDSRGTFGRIRAPGGDDDGSGTGHVLAIAQAIAKNRIRFHKEVQLCFFAGEEQGLFGSAAYAKKMHSENATILLQTQADMLGYHDPKEPMQLGFPATIGTPEAAWFLGNLSEIYSPELVVGTTAACCSDHQSFVGYGFPATQVFERNGWIADPMYHNSGDLSLREGYDFEQIYSIAKVTFAGLLEVAGYTQEGK